MSCDNLLIPKPQTAQCPTSLFGVPYGAAGRTVAGTTFPIAGIILHCYDGTVAELCNELKCRTRSSVISGSYENSFHYSIGAESGSGAFLQHVEDGNISWAFGAYKNNTYATVPPPNIAINWPVLQGLYGINTTPDVYVLNIALAIGHIVDATQSGCYTCPTSSGLQQSQHDILVQMLAYLAQEYSIPIDQDHINFHDLIHCGEGRECPCTDIATLLVEVASFCPPCEEEAVVAPEAKPDDEIEFIYGITEPCCPTSPGCAVKIPWNSCFVGDLAEDGDLTSYILGLSQDPTTGQWCMTRGCLSVLRPLGGCGTVDDPLQLDRCGFDDWLDTFAPLSAVQRVMGIDDNGCLTLQNNDSWFDMVVCAQPENATATPEWVLAKTDNTCPEWVTPTQIVQTGLTVTDTSCIDVTFVGGNLTINPIIAPAQSGVPNTLQCVLGEGLYVPQVLPVSTDCISVTNNGDGTYSVATIISPDANNNLVCQANGLASFFSVANTDCINLSWVNNVLTATPAISIDLGGVQNILSCQPSGMFVPDLTPTSTDCLEVTYTSTSLSRNLSIAPIIAPTTGGVQNVYQCLATGMFVPRGGNAAVNGPLTGNGSDTDPLDIDFSLLSAQDLCDLGDAIVEGSLGNLIGLDGGSCVKWQSIGDVIDGALSVTDTDCINMTLASGNLSAILTFSGAQGGVANAIQCIAGQGLYAPLYPALTIIDTNCIDLTYTQATGTLQGDIVISPDVGNNIECRSNGLYATTTTVLSVLDTDCIDLTLAADVLSAVLTLAPTQGAVQNAIQCIAGQGLYAPLYPALTAIDDNCLDLTYTQATGELRASIILDPDPDNQLICGPNGLLMSTPAGLAVSDTDCLNLDLSGSVLSGNIILAGPQSGVPNIISCVPGQGLYVPQGATLTAIDTNCIDLSISPANVLTATTIIAPDGPVCDNILACTANGLYVPETRLEVDGVSPAGGNVIGIDTDCDDINEFIWCEGFCELVSDDDCPNGGIGADYMVRDFDLSGTTLTVNGAPEHYSVSMSDLIPSVTFIPAPLVDVIGTAPGSMQVTNPSQCRAMPIQFIWAGFNVGFAFQKGPGDPDLTLEYSVNTNVRVNGGLINNPSSTAGFLQLGNLDSDTYSIEFGTQAYTRHYTIPPGATFTFDVDVDIDVIVPHNATIASRIQIEEGTMSVIGSTTS